MNNWNKIKKKSLGEIPQEASENIQAPELAPSDKRITGRTRQLNLKVKEEIYWLLKEMSFKEKKLMTEILEEALMEYKKAPKNKDKDLSANFPSKETTKIKSSINQVGKELPENSCSFFGQDDKTHNTIYLTCDKPLFDWKKRLCRSHHHQVRKRFNEFTKDMSISSTAGWEMSWEQSNDWQYFWNLGEEKGKK